jgi:hypothetical protein
LATRTGNQVSASAVSAAATAPLESENSSSLPCFHN